jgi:hypothetical protein
MKPPAVRRAIRGFGLTLQALAETDDRKPVGTRSAPRT